MRGFNKKKYMKERKVKEEEFIKYHITKHLVHADMIVFVEKSAGKPNIERNKYILYYA